MFRLSNLRGLLNGTMKHGASEQRFINRIWLAMVLAAMVVANLANTGCGSGASDLGALTDTEQTGDTTPTTPTPTADLTPDDPDFWPPEPPVMPMPADGRGVFESHISLRDLGITQSRALEDGFWLEYYFGQNGEMTIHGMVTFNEQGEGILHQVLRAGDWDLEMTLYQGEAPLYTGETTIRIIAGQTTQAQIVLRPIQGSVDIAVVVDDGGLPTNTILVSHPQEVAPEGVFRIEAELPDTDSYYGFSCTSSASEDIFVSLAPMSLNTIELVSGTDYAQRVESEGTDYERVVCLGFRGGQTVVIDVTAPRLWNGFHDWGCVPLFVKHDDPVRALQGAHWPTLHSNNPALDGVVVYWDKVMYNPPLPWVGDL